jgi:ATP-binding cassette subfamily B protein
MGFFTGLGDEAYDRQYDDRELIRRIYTYFKPHRYRLGGVGFYLVSTAAAAAAIPVVVSRGVDLLVEQSGSDALFWVVGIVFIAGIYTWIANWLRRRILTRIVGDVILKLRTDAFRAASDHDLSFFDEFSSGRIVSRITSDTRDFGQLTIIVTDLFSQITEASILGVVLIGIEWRLSLWIFGSLPLLYLVASGFRSWARTVTRKGMRAMANVNAAIKETVSGIAVAKNFRQEPAIYDEFKEANVQSFRVNVQRGLVLSLVFPTLNAISGVVTGILVYAGGMSAIAGAISVGAWYLFIQSVGRFFFPILNLSAFTTQVQSGLSAAERVFALIDAETSLIQIDSKSVPLLKGDIRFQDVDFRYSKQEEVLQRFNLHIHPGESVALVGHTGAGKSSIAKLVARFYEFQGGKILIDGQDIRTLDLQGYRGQLGIVSQIPFLFSGTVAENICYACAQVSEDEVDEIAHEIGEGEWLETLPQGVFTQVGERGERLSMGQRQLVSLLRVLVQRPAIFILDEATASIDPFTEFQIQRTLNMILENSTSILIAHRLSTIKAADRIIVLEDGRIIEEGDHQSLLSQKGHYANLYNTYFRHQSLQYAEESRVRLAGSA